MKNHFPESAWKIFSSKGTDIIQEIGYDTIKDVVFDVLCGKNLRDSTELLTRKRIISLNAASLVMLMNGSAKQKDFIEKLPHKAANLLTQKGLSKQERWLTQWSLGLTDKAVQNVLRDDVGGMESYKESYVEIVRKSIEEFQKEYGDLTGELTLNSKLIAQVNWDFLVQLMTIVGSETMAIRGSDKSTFGKMFEKLILGSLLSVLGFNLTEANQLALTNSVFWLSSREDKRESDATILYKAGKGARFDIGFIGRGNPEISLDKVSRFEREIELGGSRWYMATVIIVDKIGAHSRIEEMAKKIDGNIVQMSGSYWPLQVARVLKDKMGYKNPILDIPTNGLATYLKEQVDKVPFDKLTNIPAFNQQLEATAILTDDNSLKEAIVEDDNMSLT